MNDRIEKALLLSEEILEDIETERVSVSSIALRCMRLARIINDVDALKWLEYETSGYPRIKTNTLENDAFEIAYTRGRKIVNDDPNDRHVFSDLADELESSIVANKAAIQSFKSEGVSVSGEYAMGAMATFTNTMSRSLANYLNVIKQNTKRISIIKGNYYKYVLSVNYELKFSGQVEDLFNQYRMTIDSSFVEMVPEALRKLDAIYNNLASDNNESWSQSLTTCRRFFEDVSNILFTKYLPEYSEKNYQTKSGKELDVSGDKYLNRLYSVLDIIERKTPENTLIGSHIIHIIDWIDKLHDNLCKGVHADITYEEASRVVIHTYTCLGDICTLMKNA